MHVTQPFVSKLRPKLKTVMSMNSDERTFTHHKTGAPAKMNTARVLVRSVPDVLQVTDEPIAN
jgi:hypothetical protein